MKMIISNICPICNKYIEQEQKHQYTINRHGKRKYKQYFHEVCFNNLQKVVDNTDNK